MDIARLARIDGDGQAGIGHRRHGQRLGFAQVRPAVVGRRGAAFLEGRQADDIEGNVALLEQGAPVPDHDRQYLAVLIAALGILLALVPQDAGDRQRRDGLQHAFVQHRRHDRPVLIADRQGLRRAGVDAELPLPGAGQRDFLVAQFEEKIVRLRQEAARGLGL